MIELLSPRRFFVLIGVLLLVCIIIVILEDSIADHVDKPTPYLDRHSSKHQQQPHIDANVPPSNHNLLLLPNISQHHPSIQIDQSCWEHEEFTIQVKCAPCKVKERLLSACQSTGYKEHLHCSLSGDVFRSCDSVTSVFWVFQFFMICLSLVFNFYVKKRQVYLNRLVLERIEKQIASGV